MIRDNLLTNGAYGFPRAHVRSLVPRVLAVVHITANMAVAQDQRNYANRAGSNGPSAHYYIDRSGDGIRAIEPERYAAWSNGDMAAPKLTNGGVRYLDALKRIGRNVNEGCYLEIECVGTATAAGQWTDQQFATVAKLIADAAHVTGIAIDSTTVLPHAFINSVDRAHCPALDVTTHMTRLIAEAKGSADVIPAPITDETPKIVTVAAGTWYELDGTVLSAGHPALPARPSPYGVGTKRAIYAEIPPGSNKRRVVLVNPKSVIPVPTPDCTGPVAAEHERTRQAAIDAVTGVH